MITNASDWITRNVSRLRPGSDAEGKKAGAAKAPAGPKSASVGPRPLAERLEATLRRNGEALAPRPQPRPPPEQPPRTPPRTPARGGGRRAPCGARWPSWKP